MAEPDIDPKAEKRKRLTVRILLAIGACLFLCVAYNVGLFLKDAYDYSGDGYYFVVAPDGLLPMVWPDQSNGDVLRRDIHWRQNQRVYPIAMYRNYVATDGFLKDYPMTLYYLESSDGDFAWSHGIFGRSECPGCGSRKYLGSLRWGEKVECPDCLADSVFVPLPDLPERVPEFVKARGR
jgi:hypothetical protein